MHVGAGTITIQKLCGTDKYFIQLDEGKLKTYIKLLYEVVMTFTDETGWELTLEKGSWRD